MKKEFICIVCPKGCHISVDGDNITGYTCPRGLNYVKQELIDYIKPLIKGEVKPIYKHDIPQFITLNKE